MDEITKKWLNLGFLYGLDESLHTVLAHKYEEIYHLLSNDENTNHQERIETAIFPVLRRVFTQYKNVNVTHLYNHFNTWMLNNWGRIELALKTAMNGIDVEAEEIGNYCSSYIEEFKTNITPMKYLSKHKL